MKLSNLPRPRFVAKSLSRQVYRFCWAPFQACFDLVGYFLTYSLTGLLLAAFGWGAVSALMFFAGELTHDVAIGLAVIAALAGMGITLILAFWRLLS